MDSSTEFTLQTLDGGSDPQDPSQAGDEGNLDIQVRPATITSRVTLTHARSQYTVGIATGVPVNFLSVKDSMLGSDLTGLLDTVNFLSSASEEDLPTVMTTSYGYDEATLSPALMTKLCNAIGCLGARGVSVLFASGDGGVAGAHADECTQFVPEFPASCP
jgi:tripeptidyl-peptidase-1